MRPRPAGKLDFAVPPMNLIAIGSLDDPRLIAYRHLKEHNATRRENLFIVEGDKLVERLLASPCEVGSLLLAETYVERFAARLPEGVPAYVVPQAWVEELVGFNFHRGVLGCGRRPANPALEAIARPAAPRSTLVVCPDVQNPENLGALFRLARGFGVDGVLLGPRCADPLSRRVLRVSMGASLEVPWRYQPDIQTDLARLRDEYGYELWATVVGAGAVPLGGLRRPPRLGLLFGSEGHGLPSDCIAQCRQRVTIRLQPGVDSLNVAVAAGIFLYELFQE